MSLTAEENELMCRVNPGAPMGAMLSEYWWPVLRSEKLVADGAPERVRLLGRDFVAFRDTKGAVGFLDEGCPHRHVSMVLARNEECGLRCLMHGWKVDVDGNVVDTPNEFGFSRPERIKTRAYQTREAGGMVWVHIGEGEASPFPNLPFNECEPGTHVMGVMAKFRCNWVQLMETLWDPAHVQILHGTGETMKKAWDGAPAHAAEMGTEVLRPLAMGDCETRDTDWGFEYRFGRQGAAPGDVSLNWVPTVMPCWIYIGVQTGLPDPDGLVFGHVPIDDENTILWQITYNNTQPLGVVGHTLVKMADDPDNWRPEDLGPHNNWRQDREAMANGSFTGIGEELGITGLLMQDVAVAESMGGLVDRGFENLGPADRAIMKGRRVLLAAVRAHMAGDPALGAHADLSEIGRSDGAPVESRSMA
jgi:phthalate 4,5-dioxygenase